MRLIEKIDLRWQDLCDRHDLLNDYNPFRPSMWVWSAGEWWKMPQQCAIRKDGTVSYYWRYNPCNIIRLSFLRPRSYSTYDEFEALQECFNNYRASHGEWPKEMEQLRSPDNKFGSPSSYNFLERLVGKRPWK